MSERVTEAATNILKLIDELAAGQRNASMRDFAKLSTVTALRESISPAAASRSECEPKTEDVLSKEQMVDMIRRRNSKISEYQGALNQQVTEYESRGQVLYAGLGAPSSIRLVYDLLGKEKPEDLPAIENRRDMTELELAEVILEAQKRREDSYSSKPQTYSKDIETCLIEVCEERDLSKNIWYLLHLAMYWWNDIQDWAETITAGKDILTILITPKDIDDQREDIDKQRISRKNTLCPFLHDCPQCSAFEICEKPRRYSVSKKIKISEAGR